MSCKNRDPSLGDGGVTGTVSYHNDVAGAPEPGYCWATSASQPGAQVSAPPALAQESQVANSATRIYVPG